MKNAPEAVRRVFSGSPYEASAGFCRALRHGDRIHVAGTAPIGPDSATVGVGDPYAQAERCLEIIVDAVVRLGGKKSDIVRTRIYVTAREVWPEVARAHGEHFAGEPPVATCVVVAGLLDREWLVEIEADAVVRGEGETG